MEKPIQCATSLDDIYVRSEQASLSSSSSSLSSEPTRDSILSGVRREIKPESSNSCVAKLSDNDKDYASLKASLRKNFEKVFENNTDESYVGNLEAIHAIEQAFLNDAIPDDLQWQAILLAGIPGTGKTKLMKIAATKIAKLKKKPVSVVVVKAGDMYNKYLGQTEKTPQALYEIAREERPTLVIIDEVDGLLRNRSDNESDQSRRFKNAMLQEIQGSHSMTEVVTICSTNKPAEIDKGFIRRFSKIFIIGLPNSVERIHIFKKFLNQYSQVVPINYNQIDFDYIQNCSKGFTGDDIRKAVSLIANENCKISLNGQLIPYKNIETIRAQLESSLKPVKIVPVPIETDQVANACKMIGISYKPNDIKELNQFASDNNLPNRTAEDSGTQPEVPIYPHQHEENGNDECPCAFYNLCNPC